MNEGEIRRSVEALKREKPCLSQRPRCDTFLAIVNPVIASNEFTPECGNDCCCQKILSWIGVGRACSE